MFLQRQKLETASAASDSQPKELLLATPQFEVTFRAGASSNPRLHACEQGFDVSTVDAVLVSNHLSMQGLPCLTERGDFRAQVFATEPTAGLGRLLLEEIAVSTTAPSAHGAHRALPASVLVSSSSNGSGAGAGVGAGAGSAGSSRAGAGFGSGSGAGSGTGSGSGSAPLEHKAGKKRKLSFDEPSAASAAAPSAASLTVAASSQPPASSPQQQQQQQKAVSAAAGPALGQHPPFDLAAVASCVARVRPLSFGQRVTLRQANVTVGRTSIGHSRLVLLDLTLNARPLRSDHAIQLWLLDWRLQLGH